MSSDLVTLLEMVKARRTFAEDRANAALDRVSANRYAGQYEAFTEVLGLIRLLASTEKKA